MDSLTHMKRTAIRKLKEFSKELLNAGYNQGTCFVKGEVLKGIMSVAMLDQLGLTKSNRPKIQWKGFVTGKYRNGKLFNFEVQA